MRALRSLAAIGAVAATTAAVSMGAAAADPGTPPPTNSIVSVSPPLLDGLFNQFTVDYDATNPPLRWYNWDSSPAGMIETKSDKNCTITRPDGSNADIIALNQNLKTADGHYCIDFVGSTRNIKPTDGAVASVDFARNATTWAAVKGGHATISLTPVQLHAIYDCSDATLGGSGKPVTWNEVGGTSTDAIVPVLPQSTSSTRAFWITALGETWTTPPACVINGVYNGLTIAADEGTNPVFTSINPTASDVVVPYDVDTYIQQAFNSNLGSPGNLTLRDINNIAPFVNVAVPPAVTDTVNPNFPAVFIHDLYAIVRSTGVTPWVPAYLQPILGAANNKGWICGTVAARDIHDFGFSTILNCGAVTH